MNQKQREVALYPLFDFREAENLSGGRNSQIDENQHDPNQRSNPQFQVTISRYAGNANLALFDHDREDLQIFTERFRESCFVYRQVDQQNIYLTFVPLEQAKFGNLPFQNAQLLMHIRLEQSSFQTKKKYYFVEPETVTFQEIKNLNGKKMDKNIFKNIRNEKYGKQIGHMLQKDDQIRFGLQNFKVVEFQHKFQQLRQKSQVLQQSDANIFQQEHIQQGTCKICLTSDNQSENPLLQPCKCKGSCQYLHLDCLKTWLNSNVVKQTRDKVDSYTWTKFQCEICKVNYPLRLRYKDKIFQLATYEIPKSPYFALQRLRQGPRKKVLIIKAFFEPISIGRNPENDIALATNSVSRKHACIEYKSGNFFLRDLQSKFGTLVKVKNNLRIDGKIKLQVGDLLLRFDLVYKKYGNEYVYKHN